MRAGRFPTLGSVLLFQKWQKEKKNQEKAKRQYRLLTQVNRGRNDASNSAKYALKSAQ